MKGLLLAALFVLACIGPADAAVRYFVDDTTDILKTLVTDDTLTAPTGETAVTKATIETACSCNIYLGGTWDGTDYTPPAGITIAIDPTTDAGSVQAAAHVMMDAFDGALSLIFENRLAWPQTFIENAVLGIHWMSVNGARVALNSTRTAANRVKFLEEAASFPAWATAGIPSYVDAMDSVAVSKDWSWVNPETDPPSRYSDLMMSVSDGFISATNVEDAPPAADLIGRAWISDIP